MLQAWVISLVAGDGSDGDPWHSPVTDDFGIEYGPYELHDTLASHIPYRHPDGTAGYLKAPIEFWSKDVTTDGVYSSSDLLAVGYPIVPPIAIAQVKCSQDVAVAIHGDPGYMVLAAEDWDTGEPLIYGGSNWGRNEPIPDGRWTPLRNKLVALGVDATTIDNWRTAHPEGTPTQFFVALKNYIEANNPG